MHVEACHRWQRGVCQRGSSCRYRHVAPYPEAASGGTVPPVFGGPAVTASLQIGDTVSIEFLGLRVELVVQRVVPVDAPASSAAAGASSSGAR